jgi:hypothetical protein
VAFEAAHRFQAGLAFGALASDVVLHHHQLLDIEATGAAASAPPSALSQRTEAVGKRRAV